MNIHFDLPEFFLGCFCAANLAVLFVGRGSGLNVVAAVACIAAFVFHRWVATVTAR